MNKLIGTGVAMITPFNKNAEIDFPALEKITQHILNNGVEYLVVLGTTGESVTLNSKEKQEIFEAVKKANTNKKPLVAGIGGNYTDEIVKQLKSFDFSEIDAVLSVSPYYNKPTQEGIYQHYMKLADASPKPIILYNVPGRTGSNMSADTTLKLSNHPNIIGIKEASANFEQCMIILRDKPKDFLVISGDDSITLPFISLGMNGVISVIANAFPTKFSNMVRLALVGNLLDAQKIHFELLESMIKIFADGSPGGIKEIMNELGLCETTVRLPLVNVNADLAKSLRSIAHKLK